MGNQGGKIENIDADGDTSMDSEEGTPVPSTTSSAAARSPAFSSIGSPAVPPPESLQAVSSTDASAEAKTESKKAGSEQ